MKKNTRVKNAVSLALALGLVVVLGACAAKRAAVEHLTRADLALQQTQQTQAAEFASLELYQAQEKITAAKNAKEEGDYDESKLLSQEALVTIQLANAKVLDGKTQAALKDSRMSTETLKKETKRNRQSRSSN